MQITRDIGELEAMGAGQRQDDAVLGRRCLQLEIELPTKPLAERKSPRPIHSAAEGRMDDELHAAGFIEESLEDDDVLEWAARRARSGHLQGM